MTVLPVHPDRPDPEVIARAAKIVRGGGLVAFPTETVYGLGANALDEAAVRRIFVAKGRPSFNPLIAHIADRAGAERLVAEWPPAAEALAEHFWPGPLTLVLPRRETVPLVLTGGMDSVAVRLPSHPVARALIRAAGVPLAAPSANRSTQISPTSAAHVEKSLGDRIDMVLDAGPTEVGIESTVLSLIGSVPLLLRPGSVSLRMLREVIGDVATAGEAVPHGGALPSPGMMERHYSPRAEVLVFEADGMPEAVAEAQRGAESGRTVGALTMAPFPAEVRHPLRMPPSPVEYARGLYAALHALDDAGCDLIVVEAPPGSADWEGVRDRLRRAARR
jgi:L-threonylcarbamoyladenylate synthase